MVQKAGVAAAITPLEQHTPRLLNTASHTALTRALLGALKGALIRALKGALMGAVPFQPLCQG